jgi:ATP-dependent helicase/nuclease subunit A
LYGVLRSPLFGIPDDDLAQLRLETEAENLWTTLETAYPGSEATAVPEEPLADARACIDRWRRLAGTHPEVSPESATLWGTLLSRIIDETGYLASVAGDERPRQAAVNVNQFREQLRSWEEAGVKTPAELVSRIETRRDVEAHAAEATIPEEIEGVQLRTVHSAKGLEFNIVVVPELGTEFNFQTDVDEDGKVYFEEFDLNDNSRRTSVLGIKAPTPDDPFTTDDTLVRRVMRDRMKRHERAELKRLLYVAMTRARDHILLSGLHELEESNDSGVVLPDARDGAEANCWRDWLQPVLLERDEDAGEGDLLAELADSGVVETELSDSEYRVVCPDPPVKDWRDERGRETPSFAVDVPSVEQRYPPTVVTASDYADLVADGDTEHYGPEGDADITPATDTDALESASERSQGLRANTLGNIVHRICERRPARDRWAAYAQDVATRKGESLTADDRERITTYAERAIDYVDEYEAARTVTSTHDELSVVARFDGARVEGDIDHLVVTPDAFHVIDYKTNDLRTRDLDGLVAYYRAQLRAYAVALHQSDPNRTVHLVLYFTDAPEARTERFDPADLDNLGERIDAEIAQLEE